MKHFVGYYSGKNPTKRLSWCLSQGSATVRVSFSENAKDCKVSTLQAVVLLWFNASPSYTLEELATVTGIEKVCRCAVLWYIPLQCALGYAVWSCK